MVNEEDQNEKENIEQPSEIEKPLSLQILEDKNSDEINPLNAQPPIFTIGESNIEPIETEDKDNEFKEVVL